MAEVNFDADILDFNGEPIPLGKDSEGKTFTLRDVVLKSLNHPLKEGGQARIDDKTQLSRFKLMLKIMDAEKLDLSTDEITLIKDAVRIHPENTVLVIGRSLLLVDSRSLE